MAHMQYAPERWALSQRDKQKDMPKACAVGFLKGNLVKRSLFPLPIVKLMLTAGQR